MSFITNGVTLTTFRLSDESRFTCVTSHITNWSTVRLAEGYKYKIVSITEGVHLLLKGRHESYVCIHHLVSCRRREFHYQWCHIHNIQAQWQIQVYMYCIPYHQLKHSLSCRRLQVLENKLHWSCPSQIDTTQGMSWSLRLHSPLGVL